MKVSREYFDEAMAEYRCNGHSDDWLWGALFGISDRELTEDEKAWARGLKFALKVDR